MMMFSFRKKQTYVNKRVTVSLTDGREVTHKATEREISPTGRLHLTSNGVVVADYMPGTWASLSVGHRAIRSL
jgi:hypothetical protein